MSKFKKLFALVIIGLFGAMITACSGPLDKTTNYYNCSVAPSQNYFRLEKSGDFNRVLANSGMNGTYEKSGDKVTFTESSGGSFNGYIKGDYLLYCAYDKNPEKIPAGDKFDIEVKDSRRVTITFKADGTMERKLEQYAVFDYSLTGTYERKGDFITCTYKTEKGNSYSEKYGIRNGVLYDCYSSNLKDFDETEQSNIKSLSFPEEKKVDNTKLIITLVVIGVIIVASFVFIFFKKSKPEEEETEEE